MEVIMEAVEAIKEVGMVVVLVAAVVVGMDITNMAVVVGQVREMVMDIIIIKLILNANNCNASFY